jgi:hypothetical protein
MALIVTCRDRAPGRGGLRLRHRPGPARPGSANGRRAWWTGTWTARPTALGCRCPGRTGDRLPLPADHQRRLHRPWHRHDPGAADGPPGSTRGDGGPGEGSGVVGRCLRPGRDTRSWYTGRSTTSRPLARPGPWCLLHGRPVRGVWRARCEGPLLRESGGARATGMRDGAVPGVDPGAGGRAGRHALAGLCMRRRVRARI